MAKKTRVNIPIILALFVIIPVITIVAAFVKLGSSNTKTTYVKIKVSQGLWWANTGKPDIWLAKAINNGDKEYNLLGKPILEIVEVRRYPFFDKNEQYQDKFNVYLKVKLSADYNEKNGSFSFKRTALTVGAPIEINTSSAQITGTVMDISDKQDMETYEEKTVTLTKKFAFPWEFDAIQVGDKYFDGEDNVFEVISKKKSPTAVIDSDYIGNINANTLDETIYLVIEAKMRLRKDLDGNLIFAEESVLNNGSRVAISTQNFRYENFIVGNIK